MIAVENCVQTGVQSPTPAETFIGLSGLQTFQFHVTHSHYKVFQLRTMFSKVRRPEMSCLLHLDQVDSLMMYATVLVGLKVRKLRSRL